MPEMKQEYDLTPADFERRPVWVGVHNLDMDEPWYEESDEETFRPWTGPLPFAEKIGIALVKATFVLADGSVYPGYCRAVADDWDLPPSPMMMRDEILKKPASWSAMHGGVQLSVLLLQSPTIYINGRPFDFQLRIPRLRKTCVQSFYAAVGKTPQDVFPLRFAADSGLAAGIISGKLDGFYDFPLWRKDYVIDTGESSLRQGAGPAPAPEAVVAASESGHSSLASGAHEPETGAGEAVLVAAEERIDLSLEDFRRHPVWVRVQFLDKTRPILTRFKFRPWTGSLPVGAEKEHVRIPATFVLRDGSEYPGYVGAVPENWADILPPPTVISSGGVFQVSSPRVRFEGSPLAIVGEQQPAMFVDGQKFWFWCRAKDNCHELRQRFYKALGKEPEEIFPIRFQGTGGLSTGIVTGEIEGFYETRWGTRKPPKVVR